MADVWGFVESDRGKFGEEILGGWMEAQIISSDEGKVMGVTGGAGGC